MDSKERESLNGLSDEVLAANMRQGCQESFRVLVTRYKEKIMRSAFVILGNWEDAEEAAQETFCKVYRKIDRFHGQSSFSTWLYRVAMNASKDFLRKKRWHRLVKWKSSETEENFFKKQLSHEADPGETVMNRELGRAISRAVSSLPMRQRWMFALHYIEGWPYQEIAASCDVSLGTVKAALHGACMQLRKRLEPYQKGESFYGNAS